MKNKILITTIIIMALMPLRMALDYREYNATQEHYTSYGDECTNITYGTTLGGYLSFNSNTFYDGNPKFHYQNNCTIIDNTINLDSRKNYSIVTRIYLENDTTILNTNQGDYLIENYMFGLTINPNLGIPTIEDNGAYTGTFGFIIVNSLANHTVSLPFPPWVTEYKWTRYYIASVHTGNDGQYPSGKFYQLTSENNDLPQYVDIIIEKYANLTFRLGYKLVNLEDDITNQGFTYIAEGTNEEYGGFQWDYCRTQTNIGYCMYEWYTTEFTFHKPKLNIQFGEADINEDKFRLHKIAVFPNDEVKKKIPFKYKRTEWYTSKKMGISG